MNMAYHDLVIFNCKKDIIREGIFDWISKSKFRFKNERQDSVIIAIYPGWYGFGITDKQTRSELEIIIKEVNNSTAVSIYHHTQRVIMFVGIMSGDILKNEVINLISYLRNVEKV